MWVVVAGLGVLALVRQSAKHRGVTLWLLMSIVLITGAFSAYTLNQLENGYSLVMLAAGIATVSLRRALAAVTPPHRARGAAIALSVALCAAAVRDTVVFARDVDATRIVLDTTFDAKVAEQARRYLPPELAFLGWTNVVCSAEEFSQLLAYLKDAPANFALIGDLTPLYALTGKPSVNPSLWLHPGLTLPHPGTVAFSRFEQRLLDRMRELNARLIVIEEPFTSRFLRLDDFPALRALVDRRGCGNTRFGNVRVVQLCD
jgi:hypothetical protein